MIFWSPIDRITPSEVALNKFDGLLLWMDGRAHFAIYDGHWIAKALGVRKSLLNQPTHFAVIVPPAPEMQE